MTSSNSDASACVSSPICWCDDSDEDQWQQEVLGGEQRSASGVTMMLYDLGWALRRTSPHVDNSMEVLVGAQRIADSFGDGTSVHTGAALILASKLLSSQYSE